MKLLRILLYTLLTLTVLVMGAGIFARHDYHLESRLVLGPQR